MKLASERPSVRPGRERLHNRIPINQQLRDGRQERPLKEPKEREGEREEGGGSAVDKRREEERGYLSKISQRLTASSGLSLAAAAISVESNAGDRK